MSTHTGEAATLPCQIRMFGAFDIQIGGETIPPLRSRTIQWLLALLVLRHGQALDRAWLAGALWPESDHPQALYNLRDRYSDFPSALRKFDRASVYWIPEVEAFHREVGYGYASGSRATGAWG